MEKESMDFDVIIIGAGPSGLAAAIRLKQLANDSELDLSVCILEKGAEVGSHILSGAVIEVKALDELLPQWRSMDSPVQTAVTQDKFMFLTQSKAFSLPTPRTMNNDGNYIISLGNFCRWLSDIAVDLGVDIFPGFAATDILYDEGGRVIGVSTGDMGVDKQGQQTPQYQPGMNLFAKQTLFAEGCRGSLTQRLLKRFALNRDVEPQTYAIGLKEIWQVPESNVNKGQVCHTIGWPLDKSTYGGSFLYHLDDDKIAVGFVIGLDYKNPWLSPFDEFQRFKTHPAIAPHFKGGERISYGARALNEGGYQSIPQLSFPGGALIGDSAGFINVPKIKGTHTAMKTGMIAAERIIEAVINEQSEITNFNEAVMSSWVGEELYRARNIRPAFKKGLFAGLAYSALDTYLLRGKAPWTFRHHLDHKQLIPAAQAKPIDYPKPDNILTFDKPSSLYLSGTNHAENQPKHLILKDKNLAIDLNYKTFGSPEERYCPAGVYEINYTEDKQPYLQINAQNCLHCKTCDIKDPNQNIVWVPPEGGGGPNYQSM